MDDYAMQFDEDEPQQDRNDKKHASTINVSSTQTQRKRAVSQKTIDMDLSTKWPAKSNKTLMFSPDNEQDEIMYLNEEQVKRLNYQLQIQIKNLLKQLQQKQSQDIEQQQKTQLTAVTKLTHQTHKRSFDKEAHLKHLMLKYQHNQQEKSEQHTKILKLRNREMELDSDEYLIDIMKKCQQYQKYIKKLQKYINREKAILEKVKPKYKIRNSSMHNVVLHNGIQMEKMQDRQDDLDDKIHQMLENIKILDDRLKEIATDPVPQSPVRSKYLQLLHQQHQQQNNLKTMKASYKHKIYITGSEIENLKKQRKSLDRQIDDQKLTNYSMLERLKKMIQDVENEEVLQLAHYLQSNLETFHKGTSTEIDGAPSNPFTTNIIRLKRKLAASSSKRQYSLNKDRDCSNMITQFPSLSNTPIASRRRTNSQLSITTNDQRKFVGFSYW